MSKLFGAKLPTSTFNGSMKKDRFTKSRIILVVDVSPSMGEKLNFGVTKFEASIQIIETILQKSKKFEITLYYGNELLTDDLKNNPDVLETLKKNFRYIPSLDFTKLHNTLKSKKFYKSFKEKYEKIRERRENLAYLLDKDENHPFIDLNHINYGPKGISIKSKKIKKSKKTIAKKKNKGETAVKKQNIIQSGQYAKGKKKIAGKHSATSTSTENVPTSTDAVEQLTETASNDAMPIDEEKVDTAELDPATQTTNDEVVGNTTAEKQGPYVTDSEKPVIPPNCLAMGPERTFMIVFTDMKTHRAVPTDKACYPTRFVAINDDLKRRDISLFGFRKVSWHLKPTNGPLCAKYKKYAAKSFDAPLNEKYKRKLWGHFQWISMEVEATTKKVEAMTEDVETATKANETTTKGDETATKENETTAEKNETTTEGDETVKKENETTTEGDETMMTKNETTTEENETTTKEIERATKGDETTTNENETTAKEDVTTTTEKENKTNTKRIVRRIVHMVTKSPEYRMNIGHLRERIQLIPRLISEPEGDLEIVGFCKSWNLLNCPVESHHLVKSRFKIIKKWTPPNPPTPPHMKGRRRSYIADESEYEYDDWKDIKLKKYDLAELEYDSESETLRNTGICMKEEPPWASREPSPIFGFSRRIRRDDTYEDSETLKERLMSKTLTLSSDDDEPSTTKKLKSSYKRRKRKKSENVDPDESEGSETKESSSRVSTRSSRLRSKPKRYDSGDEDEKEKMTPAQIRKRAEEVAREIMKNTRSELLEKAKKKSAELMAEMTRKLEAEKKEAEAEEAAEALKNAKEEGKAKKKGRKSKTRKDLETAEPEKKEDVEMQEDKKEEEKPLDEKPPEKKKRGRKSKKEKEELERQKEKEEMEKQIKQEEPEVQKEKEDLKDIERQTEKEEQQKDEMEKIEEAPLIPTIPLETEVESSETTIVPIAEVPAIPAESPPEEEKTKIRKSKHKHDKKTKKHKSKSVKSGSVAKKKKKDDKKRKKALTEEKNTDRADSVGTEKKKKKKSKTKRSDDDGLRKKKCKKHKTSAATAETSIVETDETKMRKKSEKDKKKKKEKIKPQESENNVTVDDTDVFGEATAEQEKKTEAKKEHDKKKKSKRSKKVISTKVKKSPRRSKSPSEKKHKKTKSKSKSSKKSTNTQMCDEQTVSTSKKKKHSSKSGRKDQIEKAKKKKKHSSKHRESHSDGNSQPDKKKKKLKKHSKKSKDSIEENKKTENGAPVEEKEVEDKSNETEVRTDDHSTKKKKDKDAKKKKRKAEKAETENQHAKETPGEEEKANEDEKIEECEKADNPAVAPDIHEEIQKWEQAIIDANENADLFDKAENQEKADSYEKADDAVEDDKDEIAIQSENPEEPMYVENQEKANNDETVSKDNITDNVENADEKEKAAKSNEDEKAIKEKEDEEATKEKEDEKAVKEKEDEEATKEKEDEKAVKEKEDEEATKEKEDEKAAKANEDEKTTKEKKKNKDKKKEKKEKKEKKKKHSKRSEHVESPEAVDLFADAVTKKAHVKPFVEKKKELPFATPKKQSVADRIREANEKWNRDEQVRTEEQQEAERLAQLEKERNREEINRLFRENLKAVSGFMTPKETESTEETTVKEEEKEADDVTEMEVDKLTPPPAPPIITAPIQIVQQTLPARNVSTGLNAWKEYEKLRDEMMADIRVEDPPIPIRPITMELLKKDLKDFYVPPTGWHPVGEEPPPWCMTHYREYDDDSDGDEEPVNFPTYHFVQKPEEYDDAESLTSSEDIDVDDGEDGELSGSDAEPAPKKKKKSKSEKRILNQPPAPIINFPAPPIITEKSQPEFEQFLKLLKGGTKHRFGPRDHKRIKLEPRSSYWTSPLTPPWKRKRVKLVTEATKTPTDETSALQIVEPAESATTDTSVATDNAVNNPLENEEIEMGEIPSETELDDATEEPNGRVTEHGEELDSDDSDAEYGNKGSNDWKWDIIDDKPIFKNAYDKARFEEELKNARSANPLRVQTKEDLKFKQKREAPPYRFNMYANLITGRYVQRTRYHYKKGDPLIRYKYKMLTREQQEKIWLKQKLEAEEAKRMEKTKGKETICVVDNVATYQKRIMSKKAKKKLRKERKKENYIDEYNDHFMYTLRRHMLEEELVAIVCFQKGGKVGALSCTADNDDELYLKKRKKLKKPLVLSIFPPQSQLPDFVPNFRKVRLERNENPNEEGVDMRNVWMKEQKVSYEKNAQSWLMPQGISADVTRIFRYLRRLPERTVAFYGEINKFREYAYKLGCLTLLTEMAAALRAEGTLCGGIPLRHAQFIAVIFEMGFGPHYNYKIAVPPPSFNHHM